MALCDEGYQFLAGHVVKATGGEFRVSSESSFQESLEKVALQQYFVKTDQESSIYDLLKAVAKERGVTRTILEIAARSDSKKGMVRPRRQCSP